MSEIINNQKEKQEQLKGIIKKLHDGADVKDVKKEFSSLFRQISPQEIAAMENSLIQEGYDPQEIQKLCDVHVEVFRTAISKDKGFAGRSDSRGNKRAGKIPGHPVYTFKHENKEAKKRIRRLLRSAKVLAGSKGKETYKEAFQQEFNDFTAIKRHYERKENQLFPFLEKKDFTGPSKVMWGKHDEIRAVISSIESNFYTERWDEIKAGVKELSGKTKRMSFMEEHILFPNALKLLSDQEWAEIRRGEADIGYAWVKPGNIWDANLAAAQAAKTAQQMIRAAAHPAGDRSGGPADTEKQAEKQAEKLESAVSLSEGSLSPEEIDMLMTSLPVDITYVDEHDKVRYFSANAERIFPRSPGIIGRSVQNCHPPSSLHVVNQIIEDFKAGRRKAADFWLTIQNKFIYIRYFPVYDRQGNYKGVMEVSQDITDIKKLEGEKRLLD